MQHQAQLRPTSSGRLVQLDVALDFLGELDRGREHSLRSSNVPSQSQRPLINETPGSRLAYILCRAGARRSQLTVPSWLDHVGDAVQFSSQ
ncbi:MAG: hypothetical protein ACM3MK_05135 [Chitinophagales bacterium]